MKIVTRIESDHLPISFEIKLKVTGKINSKKDDKKAKILEEKLIWDESKANVFTDKLQELWEQKANCTNSEKRWDTLVLIIKEAARQVGMLRKRWIGNAKEINKHDISEEGKNQRKVVWKCLKIFLKSKSENDKERLKLERNKLKSISAREKRKNRELKWKAVEKNEKGRFC